MKIKQFLVSMVVAVLGFLILAGFTEGVGEASPAVDLKYEGGSSLNGDGVGIDGSASAEIELETRNIPHNLFRKLVQAINRLAQRITEQYRNMAEEMRSTMNTLRQRIAVAVNGERKGDTMEQRNRLGVEVGIGSELREKVHGYLGIRTGAEPEAERPGGSKDVRERVKRRAGEFRNEVDETLSSPVDRVNETGDEANKAGGDGEASVEVGVEVEMRGKVSGSGGIFGEGRGDISGGYNCSKITGGGRLACNGSSG